MSFLDYLKENRGLYIDHRATPPTRPALSALEAEAALADEPISGGGGPLAGATRRRRARSAPRGVRFRHVRPAFSPSPYSDPLPYEERWETASR